MIPCPTCGNPVDPYLSRCIFCDTDLEVKATSVINPRKLYKSVNLEHGRPVVESALKRMHNELDQTRLDGVKILVLIHGYGSSGKGGKIRVECRKSLDYLLQKGLVKKVVHGEHFHKNSGMGKSLVRQYPDLKQYCRADFNNPGITVVEL